MSNVCSQQEMNTNYISWNQQVPFNYDALPRKFPTTGSSKRPNRRKNMLQYARKVPHGAKAPMKMHSIMTSYIESNKLLGAKEALPPSLEHGEYSCAVNFAKETVNQVLNFAQASKLKLLASKSTNSLQTNESQHPMSLVQNPLPTESEAVFRKNRLMLEHVMLERAEKRLQSRRERKVQESQMKEGKSQGLRSQVL